MDLVTKMYPAFGVIFTCFSMIVFSGDEPEAKRHANLTEISAVYVGGNAESSTFGFKNEYTYTGEDASLTFKVSGIRADSSTFSRTARLIAGQVAVEEIENSQTTDEKYQADLRYEHAMTERWDWYLGGGWLRNRFAGIQNRFSGGGGVAARVVESEKVKYRIGFGLQYTREEVLFEPPEFDGSYGSVLVTSKLTRKVGQNGSFLQDIKLETNLEDSGDFRVDAQHEFATSITEKTALKVGLQFLFDNQPAFVGVPLFEDDTQAGVIPFELEELDTIFTTSIAVNW